MNPDCHVALGILAVALVALCMRHWLARAERRHRSRRLKGDPKHMRLGQLVPDLDPDLDEHFEPDVLEDALDDDDFLAQLTKDPSSTNLPHLLVILPPCATSAGRRQAASI